MSGPGVGIGVFIVDSSSGQFVIGKRKGSLGAGTWALPGGHLEFAESFATCAVRETAEETGLAIDPATVRFLTAVESLFVEAGKHYVTIFMGCVVEERAEVRLMEPDKCERWEWVNWNDVERWVRDNAHLEGWREFFLPIRNLVLQKPRFDPEVLVKEHTERYGV